MNYAEETFGSQLYNLCTLCGDRCAMGSKYCYRDSCARRFIISSIYRPQISSQILWNAGYGIGYERDPYKARAINKMWTGKYRHDKTEEIIKQMYQAQPKRMNYALEKHRQGKMQRQIQAEQQFDQHQRLKSEVRPLMAKYGITNKRNEEIKTMWNTKTG